MPPLTPCGSFIRGEAQPSHAVAIVSYSLHYYTPAVLFDTKHLPVRISISKAISHVFSGFTSPLLREVVII